MGMLSLPKNIATQFLMQPKGIKIMREVNPDFYQTAYQSLVEEGVPEHLADAAARIVASDDISDPNLGRNEDDIEICRQVANIVSQTPQA
jgi:hypothetical protein